MVNRDYSSVLLAVCTRKRPIMLKQCLSSIVQQDLPQGWQANILVVENDVEPLCEELVAEFKQRSKHSLRYVHEPNPGIPQVRNRILKEALEEQSQWLVFIDDDEYAASNWLKELINAVQHYNADVIQGKVIYQYPENDRWGYLWEKTRDDASAEGKSIHSAATNNIILSSRLFSSQGLSLRFDENMRFTGGSDSDFFNRARIAGAKLIYSSKAIVYEDVPIERCSLSWLFKRQARIKAAAVYMDKKNLGHKQALKKHLKRCLQSLLQALSYLLLSFLKMLQGWQIAKPTFFKSWQKLAAAYGELYGLFGKSMNPYTTIDGQ